MSEKDNPDYTVFRKSRIKLAAQSNKQRPTSAKKRRAKAQRRGNNE